MIVPAHDEVARIVSSLERILAFTPSISGWTEVIVVDDGSDDGTSETVRKRFGERVEVVRHPRRLGKGAAVRSGVQRARGDWALFTDADLSVPIDQLPALVSATRDVAIAIGSKRLPDSRFSVSTKRRVLGGIGQLLINALVVPGFHDTQCGFKLLRSDVARELFRHQRVNGYGFDFELLFLARRLGFEVAEVPVRCTHVSGSSVTVASYLSVLIELGAVLANRLLGHYPPRKQMGHGDGEGADSR